VLTVEGDRFLEELVTTDVPVRHRGMRGSIRARTSSFVEQLQNRTLINIPLRLLDKPLGFLGLGTFGDEEGCRAPSPAELDYLVGIVDPTRGRRGAHPLHRSAAAGREGIASSSSGGSLRSEARELGLLAAVSPTISTTF